MAKLWWQPPHLLKPQEHEEERKVTWLELFYDLVYVASIIQLGNVLSDDVSPMGFVRFVALFIPIWWSWTGITFYVNRFIVDDVWHRLLIFTQIAAIAVLAMSVPDAFGELGRQFTLAYVGIRVVLILLYVRAGRNNAHARPLTNRYAVGFTLAAAIWLVAAFVPPPLRFALWAIGMIADFAVPLTSQRLNALLPPDVPHMAERYGLFTIIVLGEAFVKVITSAPEEPLGLKAGIYGLFGLLIVGSMWWLYFDAVAGSPVSPVGRSPYVWIYSHLPLAIGITAYGVGIKKLVFLHDHGLDEKYRLLIGGALVIYLIFAAMIDRVTTRTSRVMPAGRSSAIRFGAAAVVAGITLLGGFLSPGLFIGLVAAACAAPILIDLAISIRIGEAAA